MLTNVVAANILYIYNGRFMSLLIVFNEVNWFVADRSFVWVHTEEYVVVKLR